MSRDSPRPGRDAGDDPEGDAPADPDDEQWRFGVDDVGPEADAEPQEPPIEPESVSLENAAFVVLGAVLTLLLIATVL